MLFHDDVVAHGKAEAARLFQIGLVVGLVSRAT
jgi:hypothetical protein